MINKTQSLSFLCTDAIGGKHHTHGLLQAYLPGKPVHATTQSNSTHQRLWQAEGRLVGGDDDVAGKRHFEPATQGKTINRSDQRLIEIEPFDQTCIAILRIATVTATSDCFRSLPAQNARSPAPLITQIY